MYFDFKMTVWERVEVPEEFEKVIAEKIRTGEILTTDDVYNEVQKLNPALEASHVVIDDTECYMNPENNNNDPTIEIMDQDNKGFYNSVWNNIKE